ncbi:glycosyltransferase [Duncaniella freteri]|uniref:glycosyltransferase n=1 Tax=Duncaniella freteri TaxID=2530391 RepID=UPI00258878F8|nr:glycosyltransferase [Duncaniella freteri]
MKVLIVSEIWTHPIDMGNKRLIVDQADYLTKHGHEVHFLFVDLSLKQLPEKYILMKSYWGNRLHILKLGLFRKFIYNLKNQISIRFNRGYLTADQLYFDKIHKEINRLNLEYIFDACIINYFYFSKAFEKITIKRKILQTHDIFTNRNLNGSLTTMSTDEIEERKALNRADYILSVQDYDASFFKRLSPTKKVLSTFCNFNYKQSDVNGNTNLLFLSGTADFNIRGLVWFFENVWEELKENNPAIRLLIGGGICKELDNYNLPEDVELCGYIENVDEFLSQGDIFINPTYQGSGIKIKTLESVAYDKISITRIHNKIGLPFANDIPIYFSDSPKEWADFILNTVGNNDVINSIKHKNKIYMKLLNNYIDQQYSELLN